MSIGDTLNKLKTTIVQTQTKKIDAKLDDAVKDIASYKSNSGQKGYINLVRSLISKTADVKISGAGGGLFSQGVTPTAFGQGSRVMRYKSYQSIVTLLSYSFRALNVLVDNILSPDDITKQALEIKSQQFLADDSKQTATSKVRYVREVVKTIDLERRLDLIVKNTLMYGDLFAEIATAKIALTSQTLLTESKMFTDRLSEDLRLGLKEKLIHDLGKEGRYEITMDYTAFSERVESKFKSKSSSLDKNKEKEKLKILNNLKLVFHNPQFVVKLQSSTFPMCFGYLVFPIRAAMPATTLADDAINNICIAILKSLENKLPQMKEFKDDDELRDILKTMLRNSDLNRAMDIRYIPPDKMVHFYVPTTKYYPYGESIFDATQYTAKVLTSLETALAVQRLSRSTEKRKIAIEIGLPRDAKKAIEAMKEEFRKRKVSLDSFGSVDTIPSMITTFEDVYIPQKDGKPFVDISTFNEGNVDIRSKVDELKFMRDQMVAALGVPPSFIGIEENLCCVLSTTYIPLLSGETISLEEVVRNYESDVEMWTYSYDHKKGKIVPGKISWAGKTKLQTEVVRVWLDNGEYIECTPDHPFMLRDGTYKEAQLLKQNDSLMPLYTKRSNSHTSNGYTYESIYHPGMNTWQLTHRAVAEHLNIVKQGDAKDVHHLDFCPNNNDPNNLKGLYKYQHVSIHGSHTKYHRLNKVTIMIKCKICGNEFENIPGINTVTCSPECKSKYHAITGTKSWKSREKNYPKRIVECPLCGKTREFKQNNFNENKFYSCQTNDKCTKYVRTLNRITKQGTKIKCDIEYSKCEVCGEPTILSPDKQKKLNVCSIKCMNTILAKRGAKKKKEQAAVDLICPICGDKFQKPKWIVDAHENKIPCEKEACQYQQKRIIYTERYKDHWTTANCLICNEEFKCTKIYKNQTINPCCDKDTCKKEIWFIRNKENKRIAKLNHKVTKVELLEGLHDTGDIRVESHHNFATGAGVIVHNSNKSALSEENILFARTVIGHQKYLTHQLRDLIQKVFDIIDPEEALVILDQVEVSLPTPRALQYEREARYMNEVTTLIENLERIGIPKEYSKKRYLSQIDWEEVKNYEIDSKIDKNLKTKPGQEEEEEAGGLGGLGGMGGFGGGV